MLYKDWLNEQLEAQWWAEDITFTPKGGWKDTLPAKCPRCNHQGVFYPLGSFEQPGVPPDSKCAKCGLQVTHNHLRKLIRDGILEGEIENAKKVQR